MPDKIFITLEIIPGGKKYPVRINADDEELVRKASSQLRQKYVQYQQAFPDADLSEKDIMAMTAIDIATSHLRLEGKNDTAPFMEKIQQLDNELKVYLKEK